MKTPQDPRKEPFQDDEAALAKALRALPGGEPSPRVDAAILTAARDATSGYGQPRHRRRGLPGWALGTAAAAVLAVGIGLQLDLGREGMADGIPAQAPAEVSANRSEASQIEVTGALLERAPAAQDDAPAPQAKAESPAQRRQSPAAPASAPAPAPALAMPPPPPPAPRAVARETLDEAESTAAEAMATQAQAFEPERSREARSAPQPVGESVPMPRSVDSAGTLPSAFSADDVLPPVDEDVRLDVDAWLERIRERIRQGDRAGAGASIRRFERAHPDLPLPPDLAAFRP